MKQLLFGLHLPVMGFSSDRSSISNNSGSNNNNNNKNNKKNGVKEKAATIIYKRTNTFNSKKG